MAPYLLSVAALVIVARTARLPQALMQPYRRGEYEIEVVRSAFDQP